MTTAVFLEHALAHFRGQGVRVERILTDNGKNDTSHAFQDVAVAHAIRLKRTRPYRPQTNGKAEAFNKILQAEWAYCRSYTTNVERLDALAGFLVYYNHAPSTRRHRRSHSRLTPVNNVPGNDS